MDLEAITRDVVYTLHTKIQLNYYLKRMRSKHWNTMTAGKVAIKYPCHGNIQ